MEPMYLVIEVVDLGIISGTLLNNNYVIWLDNRKKTETHCVLWYKKADVDDSADDGDTEPKRAPRCPEKDCVRESGHVGKCVNAMGHMWFAPNPGETSSGDENDSSNEKAEDRTREGVENPNLERFYCTNVIDGRQCIKEKDHKGDCLFICDKPGCPGYPWVATEDRPHPTNTCK